MKIKQADLMSNVLSRYSSIICFHFEGDMSVHLFTGVWCERGGSNNIQQQNRSSYGCLFSIDLADPGRIVDGAPYYRPSLVLARLAVARGTTAVLQVGAVCSNKRFFLCRPRRHCSFVLRVISRRSGEVLRNHEGAGDDEQVKGERAGAGHCWKRL